MDDGFLELVRRRAREREARKSLLVGYIGSRRAEGARMAELQHLLPALSRSQIQVLLRELVRRGAVHVHGRTKAARWYPGARREDCRHAAP